ncbi:hypothetical protein [Streptomyces sp. NPDC002640]
MANSVWHTTLDLELDLTRDDLGHPDKPGLWDLLYDYDRLQATHRVPVSQRGLRCAGICRDAGVVAWMHLRLQANGRRVAVHEKAEDEARHTAAMSDEHKAYQERIVRTAEESGFHANTEVRTPAGRTWIQSDALVDNGDGLRIGWEIQLSSTPTHGHRTVRNRVNKAIKGGITPAWHTDRREYGTRTDAHWTRSDYLPAEVIARRGDLRVVSGFRLLDFWHCDLTAVYPCPNGVRRCGEDHVTPKPKDVLFDDLVRKTASGLIVPFEHKVGAKTMRFWVPSDDRNRYNDTFGIPNDLPAAEIPEQRQVSIRGNDDDPTCRPERMRRQQVTLTSHAHLVDWQSSSHWLPEPQPCRHCRKPAHLIDDYGRPSHKVCHEAAAQSLLS